jgi:altronate hydrolase
LKINPSDNVCLAIDNLAEGETVTVDGKNITVGNIPAGHKFAVENIAAGRDIIKYGYPIGHATQDIPTGHHVHTHNLATNLNDDMEYTWSPSYTEPDIPASDLTINGFLRSDGQMGIRNELWIIPTVGCVNGQAQAIVERVKRELDTSHIDNISAFTHNYGCSQLGDDHRNTQLALAATAKHPNAGGVLVLSLGCENNQQEDFRKTMSKYDPCRVKFLIAQEVEDEIEAGFQIMKQLVETMKADRRQPLPLSMLKVGLKCGGSDGFSGITANPLAGRFSDWLIAQGGTSILTEVPEMFGSETILMNRAVSRQVFDDTVQLINQFKQYFRKHGQEIYENPSPGNKAGGITTLEDKSLGCTQKGGASPVVDVLQYARPVVRNGLNLLNAPGNDLVATSALAMSGCQIVLFTTGRGTPFGTFVPTAKISTNTRLYNFKKNWIDFDAGQLLAGKPFETLLNELISFVVDTCNGSKLKHEKAGFREIAIFKTGVTL